MNTTRLMTVFACVSFASITACEQRGTPPPATNNTTPSTNRPNPTNPVAAPDNTAKNKADGTGDTRTPLDQSQSSADIKITADIRRAILATKDMSMNAQNCKIITEKSGLVTLRGVVDTQAEKDSIESIAKATVGVTKVDNQLEVKNK